jgi:hypothetical protein
MEGEIAMRKLVALLMLSAAGVALLTVAGGANADGFTCAVWSQPDGLPGYGTHFVGPDNTHWGQWSSNNAYYAIRKKTDGTITYQQLVSPAVGTSVHWDVDNVRYTGLKNANGVRSDGFVAHYSHSSC